MADTIVVEGLPELYRKLGQFDKNLQRQMQKELRAVAEPIAADIRARAAARVPPFSARTISGIRAGSRVGAAVVRQRAGKTTGKRGDFGGTQMTYAFLPGLHAGAPQVEDRLEAMLERLAAEFNS